MLTGFTKSPFLAQSTVQYSHPQLKEGRRGGWGAINKRLLGALQARVGGKKRGRMTIEAKFALLSCSSFVSLSLSLSGWMLEERFRCKLGQMGRETWKLGLGWWVLSW